MIRLALIAIAAIALLAGTASSAAAAAERIGQAIYRGPIFVGPDVLAWYWATGDREQLWFVETGGRRREVRIHGSFSDLAVNRSGSQELLFLSEVGGSGSRYALRSGLIRRIRQVRSAYASCCSPLLGHRGHFVWPIRSGTAYRPPGGPTRRLTRYAIYGGDVASRYLAFYGKYPPHVDEDEVQRRSVRLVDLQGRRRVRRLPVRQERPVDINDRESSWGVLPPRFDGNYVYWGTTANYSDLGFQRHITEFFRLRLDSPTRRPEVFRVTEDLSPDPTRGRVSGTFASSFDVEAGVLYFTVFGDLYRERSPGWRPL